MKKVVVSDFDGTVSKVDIGVEILKRFAKDGWKEVEESWHRGEITSQECLSGEFSLVSATSEDIKSVVDDVEIADGFLKFFNMCKRNQIDFLVMSDGGDYYIDLFFKKYKLDVKFISNRMRIIGNKIQYQFLLQNPECKRCANCKKIEIEKLRDVYNRVIYIGDGYSDKCIAENNIADLIFAKGALASICKKKGISFIPFKNFNEIIENFHLI